MGLIELFLISLGLSMDAFAVSVTNGLTRKNMNFGRTLATALCFGLFQGVMPTLGFFLGQTFARYIKAFDHVIALILLAFIGGKMLYDAIKGDEDKESTGTCLTLGVLLVQGIATSIDALAVGISFAALEVNIVSSAALIASVTLVCSFAGVLVGKRFGEVLNKKAEIIGGIILVAIGLKIFIEHVFFGG